MTPTPRHTKSFSTDFKRFFLRGLAILLPTVLTLWILWQASLFLYTNVAQPINRGIRVAVIWTVPRVIDENTQPTWFVVSPEEVNARILQIEQARGVPIKPENLSWRKEQAKVEIRREKFEDFWNGHWYLAGTGLVVAIVLIYLAGVFLHGFIGRRVYHTFERLLARIPGFKHIYPHVKQVVDLIMGETPMAFKRVVLFEYPRKGVWTLGFVTGPAMKSVNEVAGSRCTCVFVPSTPTPFTGFTITVPEEDLRDVPLTVDEAVRFVLTGGVLVPEREKSALPNGQTPSATLPPAGDVLPGVSRPE